MSVRTVGGFTQGDVCEVLWGDKDQVPEWWDAQVIAISLENVTVKFLTSEALISDDPEVLIPVSEVESKLREQQLFTSSTQPKTSRSRVQRVVGDFGTETVLGGGSGKSPRRDQNGISLWVERATAFGELVRRVSLATSPRSGRMGGRRNGY